MKRILLLLLIIVVVGAVVVTGGRYVVKQKTSSFAHLVDQALGPNSRFSYGKMKVGLHDNWVHIYNLKIKRDAQTILVGEVLFEKGKLQQQAERVFLPILNLNHIEIISPSGSLTMNQLQMENVNFVIQPNHVGILGLTQENDVSSKSLSFRAFGLHGYASAMGAVIDASGLAVLTPPGAIESSIKLQNFAFISEVPPLNHVQAGSFVMDSIDLVDLYRQFTQSISPPLRLGNQDMAIDFLRMQEGENPLFSAQHFLSHTHRMEKSEQDITVIRQLVLGGQRPYLSWLNALGYSAFQGNILLNTTQIPSLQHVHIEALSIDGPDTGHLMLSGEFKMAPKHVAFMSLQPDMQIISLTLQYRDRGLARRMISTFSLQAKETQSLYLKKLHQKYRNNPWFSDVLVWLDHVATHRLIITANPPRPFTLLQFFSALNRLASSPYQAKMAHVQITNEED